jgi:putative nucleotidyltransferase with HDIG domain
MLQPMAPTREQAWTTLTEYTGSEALRRHALAVEAAVRAYARKFGEGEELWGIAGLLHDFDYEIHPTLEQHPQAGAPILREQGYPEEVVLAILSHASHTGVPRESLLQKTVFACELVRPDGIDTLEPKSVRKKLKQPSFAAKVNRDEIYQGADELGVDLDEHITFVIAALRPIAVELGLRTATDVA